LHPFINEALPIRAEETDPKNSKQIKKRILNMQVATNSNIINKASSGDLKKHNSTFENADMTMEEFAATINLGRAFCAQHKNKRRASDNFLCSGFLAVDIDHGLTLEAAQEDSYFQQYASMLYTTPSHTNELHRFRIVFELEEPITDKETMQHALTGLIGRFGADGACKDACRMFFGSKGSSPILFGKRLPTAEVDQLVIRGKEFIVPADSKSEDAHRRTSPVRSRITIPKDTVVRSARGVRARLQDIPSQTPIYCPQHSDRHPSAITLRSKHGVPGLFCSACNATFFVDDGARNLAKEAPYRFDYHWNGILNASLEEYTAYMDDEGRFSLSELRGGRIREISDRYLAYEEAPVVKIGKQPNSMHDVSSFAAMPPQQEGLLPQYNITLVKSPKGSGKTKWLGSLVAAHKAEGASVLLIGHRRALISSTAERVGLTCYLKAPSCDDDENVATTYNPPTPHYAICADSLIKLDTMAPPYDVVLVDEVEQVFAHLQASTLRQHRREVLHILRHYLNAAKSMYLLDADLNRPTIDILYAMLDDKSRNYQAIVNNRQVESKTVHLYESASNDHLIGELVNSLRRGERCFVCSNSKTFITSLEKEMPKRVSRPIKSIAITSDNSSKPEIQAFVRDIQNRALEYDVIYTSPALGTGIDITFEDDAQLIDTVYGFFQARINTHFDIDQQLARVRNPNRVNVWISPEEFNFETDDEAIKAELYLSEAEHRALLYIKPDGTKVYHHDALYDTVFSTITASQRASKNHLRKHFIDLRESNGWTVELVSNEKDLSSIGKDVRQRAKEALRQVQFEQIVQAKKIDADEYDDLKDRERDGSLREAEVPALRRYEIESFYLLDEVTAQVFKADDAGNFRKQVQMYELIMSPDEDLRRLDDFDERGTKHISDRSQRLLKKEILMSLLNGAGVMRDGQFDYSLIVDSSSLTDFVSECHSRKVQLERLFNVNIRRDIGSKPINQLQIMLKLVGLSVSKQRRDQSGGQSTILYSLCESELENLKHWTSRRADAALREEWKRGRMKPCEVEMEADRPYVSVHRELHDPLEMG
jgi:hypothetical protein